jgi:hypothetical protein
MVERAGSAAEDLRKLADRTQEELVPLNRQIFTETPPIPGYRSPSPPCKQCLPHC